MTKRETEPFHVGLTAEAVIDAAVEPTRESHLLSWSIRDLAKRLGVNPSAIYHHVDGKDLLCRRVAERVGEGLVVPDPGLEWQDWFRELLLTMGPMVMQYPGVAKWMLLHGPNTQAVMPGFTAGFAALTRAGFGEQAGHAFALLMNNPLLSIALGDDRLLHEEDGPRDHASMMREFERISTGQPGMDVFKNSLMRPYAEGGESAVRARFGYFRFCIDITITGLNAWLEAGLPDGSTPTASATPTQEGGD